MDSLGLVFGLQYSGKSSFCKRLVDTDKERYKHIEVDEAFDYLTYNRDSFLYMIKNYTESVYSEIMSISSKNNPDSTDPLADYARYVRRRGETWKMDWLLNTFAVLRIAEHLQEVGDGIMPLVDGVMTTKPARTELYKGLKMLFGDEFDDIGKVMVYFDLGLDLSIERFKKTKTRERRSLIDEENMRALFKYQQVPKKGELPNTEILVLTDPKEVESALEYVDGFCRKG